MEGVSMAQRRLHSLPSIMSETLLLRHFMNFLFLEFFLHHVCVEFGGFG